MNRLLFAVAISLVSPVAARCAGPAETVHVENAHPPKIGYNEFIRPILSDNCSYCHGPDKNHRQAELRLDVRDTAVEKGAIVPGKPDESELIHRIFSASDDERMPPPQTNKHLTDRQKQLLKTWIAQGAVYEPHWAYIAPVRPAAPAVKDREWLKSPVDAFILAPLESKKLAPAKEAEKRTLLRRLSLDLIGLPPTPEEMDAFLADSSAAAYEKQVDRLMASPHYGERMAVPWLDAVRFADTVGFHGDQNQNVFPYRDYVIDAFNKNKPFDQFTIEQLAGDLLPNPTQEQLTATCFNRLNMVTREGGAQAKEYVAKYQADRVRTVAGAWLGSTMGCCECHDHKYDPFKTKDFYSLSAYWADVKQWGVYMDYDYSPNPDLRGYSNDHPFPPEAKVANAYLRRRMEQCMAQIDDVALKASANLTDGGKQREALENWIAQTQEFLTRNTTGWETLSLVQLSSTTAPPMKAKKKSRAAKNPIAKQGESTTASAASVLPDTNLGASKAAANADSAVKNWQSLADGSILLTGKAGETEVFDFTLHAGTVAAIRLEALPTGQNAGSILRTSAPRTLVALSAALVGKTQDPAKKLAFYYADADFKEDRGFRSGQAALGILGGWVTATEHVNSAQRAVWTLDKPFTASEGDKLVITLPRNVLGRVRVSVSPVVTLKAVDPQFAEALHHVMQAGGSSGSMDPLVARTYLMTTGWDAAALAEIRKIHRDYLQCTEGITPVLITQSCGIL